MSEWKKPLPAPRGEEGIYFRALRENRLLIQRCSACHAYVFYPRSVCPSCVSDQLEWVEASGQARIYSFSIVHRPGHPAFKDEVPYVVAVVELAEGNVRMMTNIINCPPDAVKVGMPVRVTFVRANDEFTIPYFEPVARANDDFMVPYFEPVA